METQDLSFLSESTGPIPYPLTNDLMFKVVLQENPPALKELLAVLLHIQSSDIKEMTVLNPYVFGQTVNNKTCIMDIRLLLNNRSLIDLEMQVENKADWTQRSVYYLCSNHARLNRGEAYRNAKPTIHIGILDFDLFPEGENEFYAEHMLMNIKNHKIFSSNLKLNVLNLCQVEKATEEERANGLYDWAKLFLAQTWEDLKQMAQEREYFKEALLTYQRMSADEKLQLELEGREAYLMDIKSARQVGEEHGLEQGQKLGLEQGQKLGLEQGQKLGLASLVNTLKSLDLSKEDICAKVRANAIYQDLSDDKILEFY